MVLIIDQKKFIFLFFRELNAEAPERTIEDTSEGVQGVH